MSDLVERALETTRPALEQRQHELTVTPREVLWLEVDPARLEQVLVNLLTNAAKYTELPCILDLFTQAERSLDRSQGGLGIGLCLVKRIVERHGGSVTVVSVVGRGSAFVVRIPQMATPHPLPPSSGKAPRR